MTTENMTPNGTDGRLPLLDVSAIPLIKHDILHNVKDSIDAIRDSITDDYKKELYDEIEKIKDDFENTSLEDKLELLDKIKALQDKQSTASEAIDALKQSVIRLEEGTDDDGNQGSVLDPEEITLLMKAALIEESFWTEDMIGAPSVLGKQIIGLVGLFGKIKASNIEGDLISGKTIQSYDKTKLVSGTRYENFDAESNTLGIETADGTTKGPAWQLRQDGDGYLAGGRISWEADGDVTLTGVNISFNELVDVPDFTDGISIYTSTIFLRSNEEPAVPEGGSFSDPLPRISINNGIAWEDGIPEGDGVLWTSTRIFASDFTSDKNQSTWSEPRKLADDIDFEVIYGVEGANLGDLPTPEYVKEHEGMSDYNGWYDEDKDVALQIIYMATSKKSEGKWSPWSISKIKGEDGQSINIVGIFQTLDQFKEEIAGPDLNNVPENTSYCYIVANDLFVWNITLKLWENVGRFNGKDGIDAVSTFKSTVFKRSEIDLTSADRPEGGSWKDPIPEGWSDGIPEGTGAIWMSHRTFYDKGSDEYNELSFWSIPKKMIDTQSFEVIYGVEGADLDHAQLPTPEYVKKYEGLVNYNGWYDEDTNVPEDKEIWYMATAKNDNGKWSKWNISKIKGEKGGDGKSVSISGSFDTLEEFQTRIAGINLDVRPDDISAAYVVAGDLYVWVESVGRWMNVGKFAGKDGKNAISQYKSTVYKRSNTDLTADDKPVGGIWEDSVPEGWSDGIPSGEGAIWMSYKIFYSDNSMNESTEWSIPEKMIDSQTFEVIYGTENANRNKLPKLPITEGLADTENGWYDDEYSVPVGEEIWYMATAKCDNNKWGDWSVAKIKGESGKDGRSIQIKDFYATLDEFKVIAGDDLRKEPTDISYCYIVSGDLYVWDAGELRWENKGQFTGKDAVTQYKSTVFKRSKIDLTEADKPVGGDWDHPVPSGWEDGIPSGEGAIWSSYRIFYSDDNYTNSADWSIPKKMIDVAGQFEVIYGVEGAILQNTPKLPIEEGLKDDVNGWYDDDNLIPEGKDIWYMATATCKNGEWSTWTISKIKGESGADGKSIQIKGYFETVDEFKEKIAGPNFEDKPTPFDPSYCYIVSGDLYVWDGSENKWEYRGRFTGKDSVGQFKSTAFTRFISTDDKQKPDAPEGGNWEKPWPDTKGWEDGIPKGDGAIWMSYRVFYSDEEHNKDLTWSEPTLMADDDGFEVIYGVKGASLSNDDLPTAEFVKEHEGMSNYEGKGWYDETTNVPEDQEIWYMATSKKSGGVWSNWSISKIKGESGNDGTSVNIINYYDTFEEFVESGQNVKPSSAGDCFVIAGYLYVWDAGENKWEQKGQFFGKDGASTYLHIKYAKNIEFDDLGGITAIDITDDDGESSKDAIWMGIGYNDTLEDPMPSTGSDDIYKWTKIVVDPIITPVKFKSMAFARISTKYSDDIIEAIIPTGGTYDKPVPDPYIGNGFGITWEDGIPKGEGDTKIWMTTAVFESDKDYTDPNTKAEWSKPRIMADVAGKFETAYGETRVGVSGNIDISGLPVDDKGRANPDGAFSNGWDDEPIENGDYSYMATATFEKDSWSNWKVLKIKGEKGEKGAGIKYKDSVNTIEDLVFPPENNEYDAAYIVKTNPEDTDDTQWNHLFAWTGIGYTPGQTNEKYKTDSGSWIYNGWSDTGQFNGRDGENGKTSYIYIKYAEHIEFDSEGNIVPEKCTLGSNSGEKKNRWMGIGNGFDTLEPTLDKEDEENYKPENWKQYNWIDLLNEDLTNELITLTLGTYNISAEHVAGKTIDTCVTGKDGNHIGKVELIEGTKFQEFEFVKNDEGKEEEKPKEGDLTIADENHWGPAWQLRNDGTGYLARGRISWDSNGKVDLKDVKISWDSIKDAVEDKIPDIPEIPDIKEQKFKSTVFARISPDIYDGKTWPEGVKLSGGDWDDPKPDPIKIIGIDEGEHTIEWSDGIPDGEYTLWAATRTFYSGKTTEDWSTPKILMDSDGFEVVYGTKDAKSEDLLKMNPDNFTSGNNWFDEDTDVAADDIWYMATNQNEGGKWKGWQISKIKGEKGEDGISLKPNDKLTWEEFIAIAGEHLNIPPEEGEEVCYLVEVDEVNHLFIWLEGLGSWDDQGEFSGVKGDDGVSSYIHIKYATSIGDTDYNGQPTDTSKIELTDKNGEDTKDAKYIGIAHTTSETNSDGTDPVVTTGLYKWTQTYVEPIVTPAKFKSTVFARIPAIISEWPENVEVIGGDWDNAKPEKTILPLNSIGNFTVVWFDGIPGGIMPIWSTSATFYSDKDYNTETVEWSTPKLMADSDVFETAYAVDVEYDNDGKISTKGLPDPKYDEDGELIFNYTDPWVDEPERGVDYHYMATISKSGGSWGNWNVFKIKGEKGDKGGSVKLDKAFDTVDALIAYYSDDVYGTDGEPFAQYKDNAHIIKNGPIGEDEKPIWNNHLFVWIGEEKDDNSLTDEDYFYKGWYDSGQFNGKDGVNGQSAFVHVKYAEKITFTTDHLVDVSDEENNIATENGGESTKDAKYIGIAHTTSVDNSDGSDPIIGGEDYIFETHKDNWNKYKWSEYITNADVEKAVTTQLGTYHISSNHIAGKTIDSAVDNGIDNTNNYVTLAKGTTVEIFQYDSESGEEIGSDIIEAEGIGKEGPAWQIRTDGVGYFAAGNFKWDVNGNIDIAGKITVGAGSGSTGGGNEGGNPGKVSIGSDVEIGPWNTFTVDNNMYIGDANNLNDSNNYFGKESFKIGGKDGIIYDGDKITLGNNVVFTNSGEENTEPIYIKVNNKNYASANKYIAVNEQVSFDGETGLYLWIEENSIEDFENDKHLNSNIDAAFTYKSYDSINIGDSVYAGITYYSDDDLEWLSDEVDNTTVKEVSNKPFTATDLDNWWNKTEIDGGKITTGEIDANLINVENLEVEKLNTTPNNETTNGRILISNNDIIVFDSKKENTKVLNITGNSFADIDAVPDEILDSYNIDEIGNKKQNVLFSSDRYINLKVFSITVPNTGYLYTLTINGLSHTGYIISNSSNRQDISTSYQLYGEFYATMAGSCPNYSGNNSIYSPWSPLIITAGVDCEFTKPSGNTIITLSNLSAGTYNIYLRARCPIMTGVNIGNTDIHAGIVIHEGTINTTLTPQTTGTSTDGMPLTCIASNGLRFLKSATEYFELDDNGYITYRNGSRGFGCDKDGLWLRYGSENYSISIDESGNIKTTKRS